ncbi:S41 family peptidase, partial [bacterium]|nr:S41 family peptidase [bacterium]
DLNKQNWERWKKHYAGKIKTDEDATVAINTMLASLDDPYSRYLNKKDYESQNTSIDSKIMGIGVNITSIKGEIVVVNTIEGTPAYKAGLQSRDIITKVNSKNVKGMPIADVATIVRGPEKTYVNLTVQRGKKTFTRAIQRQEIKIKTVKSSIDKKKDIGYIQVLSFIGSTTPVEFVEAVAKTNSTKGLIIDLRGNTGGLLPNAVFMANMFIPKGKIVSIVGRHGFKKNLYARKDGYSIQKPIVILVDGESASASEIFSGAMKDYHRAKLLGTKTFGKGMVQKIIPMPNETGLDLTIAKYLTPAGHDINKKGITPDITVHFTKNDILNRNDVQLNKAKNELSQMINSSKK